VKTALKVAGIVVALLIVIAIAVPLLVNVNNFRPQIESTLSTTLGRPVKVGNLSLGVFSGSVGADQLSIADDPKFSTAPFIQAKSLQVGVELMPLIFSKQLNITRIVIDHPEMTLLRNREGVWNFSSLGKSSQPAEKNVQHAVERKCRQTRPERRNRHRRIPFRQAQTHRVQQRQHHDEQFLFYELISGGRFRRPPRRRQLENRWHRRSNQFDRYRAYASAS